MLKYLQVNKLEIIHKHLDRIASLEFKKKELHL